MTLVQRKGIFSLFLFRGYQCIQKSCILNFTRQATWCSQKRCTENVPLKSDITFHSNRYCLSSSNAKMTRNNRRPRLDGTTTLHKHPAILDIRLQYTYVVYKKHSRCTSNGSTNRRKKKQILSQNIQYLQWATPLALKGS